MRLAEQLTRCTELAKFVIVYRAVPLFCYDSLESRLVYPNFNHK